MNTVAFLENQLKNLHGMFHAIVDDFTAEEWLMRAAPGQNRVGFIVWHMPRTQDNIVQLWMRGGRELFYHPDWEHWLPLKPYGIGAGITLAEADIVAETVQIAETLAYADAVHQEMMAWLHQLSDADLDQIPNVDAHLAPYPEFQAKGYREELDGLRHQPIWNLFLRPCGGHIHRHLGELELAKAILRAG